MASSSVINRTFTEQQWLSQINCTLQLDLQTLTETTTFSIFQFKDSLKSTKPESYTPQLIAIGPIHQFNPELYTMQTFKLAAAQRSLSLLNLPDFLPLVNHISRFVPEIRASYDKHFDLGDVSISWIATIDSLFLVDHLRHGDDQSARTSHIFRDSSERKVRTDSIRRDLVKMENQIPLFLLKQIPLFSDSDTSTGIGEHDCNLNLPQVLVDFCRILSPFDIDGIYPDDGIEPQHLLDLLYQLIWLKQRRTTRISPHTRIAIQSAEFVAGLWEEAKNADDLGLIQSVAAPVDRVIRLSKALGISQKLRRVMGEEDEEVLIPTASQLKAVGIGFECTRDGIRSFCYNVCEQTLWVPGFTWNPSCCEVVIRNLVAYESVAKSENLVVNGYVEIMSFLVKSVADVKVLKENGIILFTGEEDDEAVVELFKGIAATNTFDRKDKTVFDDHVKAVYEHYSGHRRIKMGKTVKKYVKVSWDVAKVMAAVLLLVMLGVQTFCDVYSCKGKSVMVFGGWRSV